MKGDDVGVFFDVAEDFFCFGVLDFFSIVCVFEWRFWNFYDIDFEILQHLKHPLYEFMMSALHPKTGDSGEEDFMPVGQQGRELALLFTVTPDEAEAMMSQGTFSDEARARFRRYNAIQLIEITKAVSTQMALYWSPAVAYGPVKQGEGEGVQSDVHPPSSEPSTVLVG
jgi:hypothetical protein